MKKITNKIPENMIQKNNTWIYHREAELVQTMETYQSNLSYKYTVRKRSQMIISLDAEKSFDKAQKSFMIKVFKRLGLQGSYINIKKQYIQQTNSGFQGKCRDTQIYSIKIREKNK